MKYVLAIFFIIIFSSASIAQTQIIDSFLNCLKKPVKNDTLRVFQYNELAWNFIDINIDSTKLFLKKSFKLSQKIKFYNGNLDALNTQGIVFRIDNQPEKAIAIYKKIIDLHLSNHKEQKLVVPYTNLGSVYYEKGEYVQAISYYNKALEYAKKYKTVEHFSMINGNLGTCFIGLGLYDKAIDVYSDALIWNKKLGNIENNGMVYLNLATVYDGKTLYSKGAEYSKMAAESFIKSGNIRDLANVYFNLVTESRKTKNLFEAKFYLGKLEKVTRELDEAEYWASYFQAKANMDLDLNKFNDALKNSLKAIEFVKNNDDPVQLAELYMTLADCYNKLMDFNKAKIACDKANANFNLQENVTGNIRCLKVYVTIYQGLGDYKKALDLLGNAIDLEDKETSKNVNAQISALNALNNLEQKEKDLELTKQKNEKVELENSRQGNIIFAVTLISLLVVILLILSVRSSSNRKKANNLLSEQKIEIENQKLLVDEKQKDILSSIHYGKRIQNTLLAQKKSIQKNTQDFVVMFHPKDIVSGDFYWSSEIDDQFYLAVCDSTGHGVPGAFMSILNITYLNEAINELKISEPNLILNHVRNRLISYLSHDGAQDGMDGVLFSLNKKTLLLTYAAAYNAPIVVRGNELILGEADRMPIGKGEKSNDFTLFSIQLQKNDFVYAYSDGFPDQFGEETGKKFKTKMLNELLLEIASKDGLTQVELLDNKFFQWKGSTEQIDDVTVVGFKI